MIDEQSIYPSGPYLPAIPSSVSELVEHFQFLNRSHLRSLAVAHGLSLRPRDRRSWMVDVLHQHTICSCPLIAVLFHSIPQPRPDVQMVNVLVGSALPVARRSDDNQQAQAKWNSRIRESDLQEAGRHVLDAARHRERRAITHSETSFPSITCWDEKLNLISEWQTNFASSNLVEGACAVCGWATPVQKLHRLSPSQEMLRILRNNSLPSHVLPDAYNVQLYQGAILCSYGLTSLDVVGPLRVCSSCRRYLLLSPPRQPRHALANFLYYRVERLSDDVREAFSAASPFDLCLISRCRSSVVTHHYMSGGSRPGYVVDDAGQGFCRGNVAIFPQNTLQLRKFLPPSGDDIWDTLCVLFSRSGQRPTVDVLKRFGPVLVNKRKVERMIKFLVDNNEWYRDDNVRFSPENFGQLFHEADRDSDIGVLQYMQLECNQPDGDDVQDVNWDEAGLEIVMDNHAYTLGDHSSQSRESMKACALAYALDRKRFLNSHQDRHPSVISTYVTR